MTDLGIITVVGLRFSVVAHIRRGSPSVGDPDWIVEDFQLFWPRNGHPLTRGSRIHKRIMNDPELEQKIVDAFLEKRG